MQGKTREQNHQKGWVWGSQIYDSMGSEKKTKKASNGRRMWDIREIRRVQDNNL